VSNCSFYGRGGKVAMALALHPELPPNLLTDLIVSDIAPIRARASEDTVQLIRAMEKIEANNIYTRKEADEILSEHEKVPLTILVLSGISIISLGSKRQSISAHEP
jgi:hypothetical protein